MSAAPAWVSYLALVTSGGSLFLAWRSYLAAGPRLSVRSKRLSPDAPGNPCPGGVPMMLTVINSGRAAVTVEGFHVTYEIGRRPLAYVDDVVDGPALPFRLDAHASESWVVDALPPAQAVDRENPRDDPFVGPAKLRFVALAGSGKSARDPVSYMAVRLIAESGMDT